MKSVRKWIRDVFGFSGNEINGFLILIPLMLLLVFSEPLYHTWIAGTERRDVRDSIELDSLIAGWGDMTTLETRSTVSTLFDFDPNTASVHDLTRLGFSEVSAKRIAAYRSKGGVFSVKSDLMKIYGMDSTLYQKLQDHIRLPAMRLPASGGKREYNGLKPGSRKLRAVAEKFDLNTADTLQLKSVYGIGSRLAARIIKFRDGLGGFVDRGQLYEVYGLDSMTVARLSDVCFISGDFIPKKININTADEQELAAHPYIRYRLARLLVSYRFQHGDFAEAGDIKRLLAWDQQELERLLPYIICSR